MDSKDSRRRVQELREGFLRISKAMSIFPDGGKMNRARLIREVEPLGVLPSAANAKAWMAIARLPCCRVPRAGQRGPGQAPRSAGDDRPAQLRIRGGERG